MVSATDVRAKDAARSAKRFEMLRGSKAIASHIGLTQRDVLQMIKTGSMPGMKVGNKFVVDTATVERWLADKMLRNLLSE